MRLITRQINAVRKSKENCIVEALNNYSHAWLHDKCSLCKEFYKNLACEKCPLAIWEIRRKNLFGDDGETMLVGCCRIGKLMWAGDETEDYNDARNIAELLYGLELYLKERRLEQIKKI